MITCGKIRSAVVNALALLAVVIMLSGSGCEPKPLVCLTKPDSVECICEEHGEDSDQCECARNSSSGACSCLNDPESQDCFCYKNPSADSCRACPDGFNASRLTAEALNEIDSGNWELGRRWSECALEKAPGYVAAKSILEQLDSDPAEYFKAKFGPDSYRYVVQPGDSLGKIAAACLKNRDYFVALARYNGIDIPHGLASGVTIDIPGSQCEIDDGGGEPPPPPPPSDDLLQRAIAEEKAGNFEKAYETINEALVRSPDRADVKTATARIRTKYIDWLVELAYELEAQDDCEGALARWDRVLELDRYHSEARFSRGILLPRCGGN